MDKKFFTTNRQHFLTKLQGAICVLSAYRSMQLTNDEEQPFVQESHFWYLCGIEKPDWWLILDGKTGKSQLVAPEISETTRIFMGGLTNQEAQNQSGVQQIISRKQAMVWLKEQAASRRAVVTLGADPYEKYYDFCSNPAPRLLRQRLKRLFGTVGDCRRDLANMRAIKQPIECQAIRKAIDQTIEGFQEVRLKLAEVTYEYEIEAIFDYRFRQVGMSQAYSPIVASGRNACTMHYGANQAPLEKNNLVVMDVGALYQRYPADITRTYGYGSTTKRQRELHDAVRQAQSQIVELIKPGESIKEYDQKADQIMRQAVFSLGLMTSLGDTEKYRTYYPHAIGHGLGVDVHETLGSLEVFQPGMVLTVEPGIYIPEEGFGTRIEDDILVTHTGNENLSGALSSRL